MSTRTDALPEFLAAWDGLQAELATRGVRMGIADYGGYRTQADTAEIMGFRDADYAKYVADLRRSNPSATPIAKTLWRRIAPYGASYHDFGAARDFTIEQRPADMSLAAAVALVQQLAPKHGLKSGVSFQDPRHLQLAISLSDAAARWKKYAAGTLGARAAAAGAASLPFLGGLGIVVLVVIIGRALYSHAGG